MKRFIEICRTELILFLRDFFGCFFTLAFPTMMLVLYGSIYGNAPLYAGASVGMIDASLPAYCAMVAGVTGIMTFPITLAEYRDKKIYKRFDATPVGKGSVICAQTVINVIMTFVGFMILLLTGIAVYDVHIPGRITSIFASMVLSISAMFSIGFFFTAAARDAKIVNLLCYLCYFIMIFLSGATVPDMLFPEGIKRIAAILPMTYAVDLMQGMFAGHAISEYTVEVAVLGGVTAIFVLTGAALYRRRDWS